MPTDPAYSPERLDLLKSTVEDDVKTRKYWGGAFTVTRHGKTIADFVVGHADSDGAQSLAPDTVFSMFSATKAFTNVLVLRAIERGQFALTTKMVEIIPEFAGPPRDRSTILHFLTHTTGMPGVWETRPGMHFDDLSELVAEVCARIHGNTEPGSRADYSPMANHVLLAEVLRRTDPAGRSINEIIEQDLFIPLKMNDTRLGLRDHMRPRHAFPDMRGIVPIKHLSKVNPGDNGFFSDEVNEAPWVGAASTTADMTRFVRMLRNGGELDGVRILSPRMVEVSRKNWTGELPNELYAAAALRSGYAPPPAYIGLGFSVRGDKLVHHQFGTLTTPETFGNYGAGSNVFWIDPVLDVTFVGITTGLLSQADNIKRFQRLSDIVVAAIE